MLALSSSQSLDSRQFTSLRSAWPSKYSYVRRKEKKEILSVPFSSDIAILQDQMTYPEFKDRLLEDIPYEEYTAAMNGFLKYDVVS